MDKEVRSFLKALSLPLIVIAMMVATLIYTDVQHQDLYRYCIFPRSMDGLKGILTGPFIHSGWSHLLNNSFPLLCLMLIISSFFKKVSNVVYIASYLITGFLVWLFAKTNSYHVGASGVVYAFISFVFWSGIFKGQRKSIVLSLLILVAYGGFFNGFEAKEGISWESHFLGFLVGLFLSFILKNVKEDWEDNDVPQPQVTQSNKSYYFPRDIFDMTKQERFELAERQRIEEEERRRQEIINQMNSLG